VNIAQLLQEHGDLTRQVKALQVKAADLQEANTLLSQILSDVQRSRTELIHDAAYSDMTRRMTSVFDPDNV
jgi:hypothetical protein